MQNSANNHSPSENSKGATATGFLCAKNRLEKYGASIKECIEWVERLSANDISQDQFALECTKLKESLEFMSEISSERVLELLDILKASCVELIPLNEELISMYEQAIQEDYEYIGEIEDISKQLEEEERYFKGAVMESVYVLIAILVIIYLIVLAVCLISG